MTQSHRSSRSLGTMSEAVEDYAKTIYGLQRQRDGPARTTAIAARLGVTPGSASAMLAHLAELGLVEHRPYHGARLTSEGRRVALAVLRRHRLLELFLAEALAVPWDQVHDEADVLEHHLSPRLERLIAARLDDPKVDPHGDPIPTADLHIDEPKTLSLEQLETGAAAVFVRVSDYEPAMLRYLAERAITPGVRLRVVERQPFGGPVFVHCAGQRHALGHGLAAAMRVTPAPARRAQPGLASS